MFEINEKINYKKNNTVKLVDSMMGSKKTSRIIEWMDSNPNKKYIFVSPLLSEVEEGGRVHRSLNQVTLEVPSTSTDTNKSKHLLSLIENGSNIACTHKLYLGMNSVHFSALQKQEYTVIIDEEVNIIDGFNNYHKEDIQWLLDKGDIKVREDDGMVQWVGDRDKIKGKHKYLEFLTYCDAKALYCTKRSDTMAVTQLPIKLFECAKEVIILTYMFKGNILDCFLRLKGFEVEPFTDIMCESPSKEDIKNNLTIVPPNNKVIDYSLSSQWWSNATANQINDVSNYIRTSALQNGLKGDDILWTVPKDRAVATKGVKRNLVKPRGYIQDSKGNPCYLATVVRATNDYRDKRGMFHCYNRYPLHTVRCYLEDYGCPVDQKVFATSELLQWLWRGCIRKGEPMVVGIASKRMHSYFLNWLNSDL